jgi:hypothetical protein
MMIESTMDRWPRVDAMGAVAPLISWTRPGRGRYDDGNQWRAAAGMLKRRLHAPSLRLFEILAPRQRLAGHAS